MPVHIPPTSSLKRMLRGTDRFGNSWIIEIDGVDDIAFRMKGKRTRYEVSAWSVLNLAVLNFIEREYREKMDAHKAGKRKRKPKAPSIGHFETKLRLALRGK